MLSGSVRANIVLGNHLCNVVPWLTENFYEENTLCNVASTMLGQHCLEILSSQCCPNTSETTLHKKTICAMLTQSTQTCFRRKITYTMLSWSAWANIAQENCLYNVHPQLMNNFAILHLIIQICFCRKITYAMLPWSAWANIAQNNYLQNAGPRSTV